MEGGRASSSPKAYTVLKIPRNPFFSSFLLSSFFSFSSIGPLFFDILHQKNIQTTLSVDRVHYTPLIVPHDSVPIQWACGKCALKRSVADPRNCHGPLSFFFFGKTDMSNFPQTGHGIPLFLRTRHDQFPPNLTSKFIFCKPEVSRHNTNNLSR